MNQIFYIFLLFCLLFLIETKAINILICFIGIILTIAIKLSNNESLNLIEGQYFSYILILVQVSALTILFGFIIMLYQDQKPHHMWNSNFISKIWIWGLLIFFTEIIICSQSKGLGIFLENWDIEFSTINQDTEFLRKLGYYLYYNNNIIKLILITLILLLAIIGLFFIVF